MGGWWLVGSGKSLGFIIPPLYCCSHCYLSSSVLYVLHVPCLLYPPILCMHAYHIILFLVQCQSLIKLNDTHSDLQLHVTEEGSVVRDGVLYKSLTIEFAGFELRDEEFVVVSKKVRKLVELLYISHPQVGMCSVYVHMYI